MATLTSDLTTSRRPQPHWRTIILALLVALVVVTLTIVSPQTGAPLALDLAVALVAFLWPTVGLYLLPGAVAFGSVAAYLLVLWAFTLAPAGPVATLREVSVLIGLLLSSDRKSWRLWVGASLVVFGAVLTAL